MWSVGTRHLQEDLIDQLKNVQIIIADTDNNKKNPSPKNNLVLVNEYINKKYKKVIEIEDKALEVRLPEQRPKVLIRSSSYFMNNREYFINFINSHFGAYRADILKDKPTKINTIPKVRPN